MVFLCCEGKLPAVSFVCHDVARDGTAVVQRKYVHVCVLYTAMNPHRPVINLLNSLACCNDLAPIYALSSSLEISFINRTNRLHSSLRKSV